MSASFDGCGHVAGIWRVSSCLSTSMTGDTAVRAIVSGCSGASATSSAGPASMDLAPVEDYGPVGEVPHHREVVGDEQDRDLARWTVIRKTRRIAPAHTHPG
jgi:hypothetical protein